MGMLNLMDESGDTKVIWDATNEDEVDAAKKQYDHLIEKGFAAYSVKKKGGKGKKISKFDRTAERIIMVPPIVGG